MKLLYSSTLPPLLFVPLVPLPLLYPLRSVAKALYARPPARGTVFLELSYSYDYTFLHVYCPPEGGVARPLEGWLNAKPYRAREAQCSARRRTR